METMETRQGYDKPDARQPRTPHQRHKRPDTEVTVALPRKVKRWDDKELGMPHQGHRSQDAKETGVPH